MLNYSLLKATLCQCRIEHTVFAFTLQVLLGMVEENPEQIELAWSQLPKNNKELQRQVHAKVKQINSYFMNTRFRGLTKTAAIWGTITNAMKVAGGSSAVTDKQKEVFAFPEGDILSFFKLLLNDVALCREINTACNIPSADLRTLGVIVIVEHLNTEMFNALVQYFTTEGPCEENMLPREVMQAIDPYGIGSPGEHHSVKNDI